MAGKTVRGRAARGVSAARDVRVVLTAAPRRAALRLAREMVERGLAACVSVIPGATSVFSWRGRLTKASESLLVIKTQRRAVRALLLALEKDHPYDVPEGLVLVPTEGLTSYLAWVRGGSAPRPS